MKTLLTLVSGILLGLVLAHVGPLVTDNSSAHGRFAALHDGSENPGPSVATSLMQTDTPLCDQPYFAEVYELSVRYFSAGAEHVQPAEFADLLFDHARHAGHFTAREAEEWIAHIRDIPGQLVDIYREDPTVLDSCYNFQVAAVGPPQ